MIDFALFCILFSTLLQAVRLVVTTIGLKLNVEETDCPEAYTDVKWNKIGLSICNYGSLILNVVAMVLLMVSISE